MPYIRGGGKIKDVFHSTNVYANNIPVALWDSPGGSAAFYAAQGMTVDLVFIDTPEIQYLTSNVDADNLDFDNTIVQDDVNTAVDSGLTSGQITENIVPAIPPEVIESDQKPANVSTGTTVTTDFSMWSASEYPKGHEIYGIVQLTAKTSLADFTTKAVLFNGGDPKWLKAQNGLTVPQILTNLSNLAKNCWEPIKSKYPNAIITNTFRQGSVRSQHAYGQAMDIQFKSIAPQDYYNIAQWVRDNVSFDQLLLEKAANAPWIHISYYSGTGINVSLKPANRVATMLVGKPTSFTPGLQQVA